MGFDEYIIEGNSYYLNDEVTLFLGLIETVFRLRTPEVYLFANYSSGDTPYNRYFDLKFSEGRTLYQHNKKVTTTLILNEEYRKVKKETPFGSLVSNLQYGKFAIENTAYLDKNEQVTGDIPIKHEIVNIYLTENKLIGLYACKGGGVLVSHNPCKTCKSDKTYSFIPFKGDMLIKNFFKNKLMTYVTKNKIYFSTLEVKNDFCTAMKIKL